MQKQVCNTVKSFFFKSKSFKKKTVYVKRACSTDSQTIKFV